MTKLSNVATHGSSGQVFSQPVEANCERLGKRLTKQLTTEARKHLLQDQVLSWVPPTPPATISLSQFLAMPSLFDVVLVKLEKQKEVCNG